MPPAEMQRQRLRHLFSSAILELWKKETGSVTSVLIEGTVCITAQGGRTTVVQLADRFAGLVSEDSSTVDVKAGGLGRLGGTLRASGGHLYVDAAAAGTSDGDHDAAAVSIVDATDKSSTWGATDRSNSKDSNNNLTVDGEDDNDVDVVDDDDDSDDGGMRIDLERGSGSVDAEVEQDLSTRSSRPPMSLMSTPINCAAVPSGFCTPRSSSKTEANDGDNDAEDSAIHDMSMSRSALSTSAGGAGSSPCLDGSRTPLRTTSVEKSNSSSSSSRSPGRPASNGFDGAAAEAGRREVDLLLSSPQDYTAQVRNAIRQRILATTRQIGSSSTPFHASIPTGFENIHGTPMSFGGAIPVPPGSPYYRTADSTPPSWSTPVASGVKQESGSPSAATMANVAAARRLMTSPYGPLGLMSPPTMPVGLAAMPSIALQNLLNIKTSIAALNNAAAAAATAAESKRTTSSTAGSSSSPSADAPNGELLSTTNDSTSAEQKIYRCDYCYKTFLFKSKYHEHLPVHTSARPFQCHLCTRTYKYKYDLRVHLRTHLGIPTKSTVCPFCAGRFTTNKFLRQHMREAHADQNLPRVGPVAGGSPSKVEMTGSLVETPSGSSAVDQLEDSEMESAEPDATSPHEEYHESEQTVQPTVTETPAE